METIRQRIRLLLSEKEMSARELSLAIGIREKEVYEHLPYVARSAKTLKKKLMIRPATCHACGYVFKDRKRFTPPGRCPRCKGERFDRITYQIC